MVARLEVQCWRDKNCKCNISRDGMWPVQVLHGATHICSQWGSYQKEDKGNLATLTFQRKIKSVLLNFEVKQD